MDLNENMMNEAAELLRLQREQHERAQLQKMMTEPPTQEEIDEHDDLGTVQELVKHILATTAYPTWEEALKAAQAFMEHTREDRRRYRQLTIKLFPETTPTGYGR